VFNLVREDEYVKFIEYTVALFLHQNQTKMNTATTEIGLTSAQSWLAEGKSFDEIQSMLNDTGLSAEDVDSVMKQVKDQRYESQRRRGLPLIGIGAMLCVLGCVVTILTSDTGGAGFHFALYGMTGVGATTIMGGLAIVLG
jgi:hypothetical protein